MAVAGEPRAREKISFAGPDVKIYQRGNAFSFDDITARFAGDTTAAATPEKPSKPWEIGIYDISIRNGRVFTRTSRSMPSGA